MAPVKLSADMEKLQEKSMARNLKFNIFRFNPQERDYKPHTDTFFLEETDSMTLYIALTKIRAEHDSSLQFDFCCRAGICGACAMMINGRPDLACKTLTEELPDEITLMPLPVKNCRMKLLLCRYRFSSLLEIYQWIQGHGLGE